MLRDLHIAWWGDFQITWFAASIEHICCSTYIIYYPEQVKVCQEDELSSCSSYSLRIYFDFPEKDSLYLNPVAVNNPRLNDKLLSVTQLMVPLSIRNTAGSNILEWVIVDLLNGGAIMK